MELVFLCPKCLEESKEFKSWILERNLYRVKINGEEVTEELYDSEDVEHEFSRCPKCQTFFEEWTPEDFIVKKTDKGYEVYDGKDGWGDYWAENKDELKKVIVKRL